MLLLGAHERFGLHGRRLLAVIKTALIVRAWTRCGNADVVADAFGCYSFEVRRLSECFERILTAAVAVVTPPKAQAIEADPPFFEAAFDDDPSLAERVRALAAMVAHGVDEQTVTLTYVDGIGGKLARRLRDAGIVDIEELALADPAELAKLRGVSATRAARWVTRAEEQVRSRSAFALREGAPCAQTSIQTWNSEVEPYRLRRALDLKVRRQGDGFAVSGGLEPHRVACSGEHLNCDCADFAKGHTCKHVLAVRLQQKDPELIRLVQRLPIETDAGGLDLFRLWFDEGKR
jgi:helicase